MIVGFSPVLKCRRLWFGRSAALFLTLVAGLALGEPAASATHPQGADLTESQQLSLQKITGAAREKRGPKKGISVLFACGESKHKTAATQVLAKDLGRDVYRVDLSKIVSKYIGETEKNLRRVFATAAEHNSILFFDEADALFGKRSEVKDSHDRYANIEINYLLRQIEKYGGIVILSTRRKEAIDPAFLRRLRFVLEFQCPGRP